MLIALLIVDKESPITELSYGVIFLLSIIAITNYFAEYYDEKSAQVVFTENQVVTLNRPSIWRKLLAIPFVFLSCYMLLDLEYYLMSYAFIVFLLLEIPLFFIWNSLDWELALTADGITINRNNKLRNYTHQEIKEAKLDSDEKRLIITFNNGVEYFSIKVKDKENVQSLLDKFNPNLDNNDMVSNKPHLYYWSKDSEAQV
jgi:hypothetical protein